MVAIAMIAMYENSGSLDHSFLGSVQDRDRGSKIAFMFLFPSFACPEHVPFGMLIVSAFSLLNGANDSIYAAPCQAYSVLVPCSFGPFL